MEATIEKQTLTFEQLDERIFETAKYLAHDHFNKRTARTYGFDDIERDLPNTRNEDLRIMFKYFRKAVEEHNSAQQAAETRIRNLRYTRNWRQSSVMKVSSSDLSKIEKLIKENPDMKPWDIYSKNFRMI